MVPSSFPVAPVPPPGSPLLVSFATPPQHRTRSSPVARQTSLLVPYISSGFFWAILKLWMKGHDVILLDVPLLFEDKFDKWTKPIIVIWVDSETQLMARDQYSEEQAMNIINAQLPLDQKRSKADIIIDNAGSLETSKLQFYDVLVQATRPLTWKEFAFSRKGITWVLSSVITGLFLRSKILLGPS